MVIIDYEESARPRLETLLRHIRCGFDLPVADCNRSRYRSERNGEGGALIAACALDSNLAPMRVYHRFRDG